MEVSGNHFRGENCKKSEPFLGFWWIFGPTWPLKSRQRPPWKPYKGHTKPFSGVSPAILGAMLSHVGANEGHEGAKILRQEFGNFRRERLYQNNHQTGPQIAQKYPEIFPKRVWCDPGGLCVLSNGYVGPKIHQNPSPSRRAQIFCNFLLENDFQRPPWNLRWHRTQHVTWDMWLQFCWQLAAAQTSD